MKEKKKKAVLLDRMKGNMEISNWGYWSAIPFIFLISPIENHSEKVLRDTSG